ncbi:MAG: exodeoxyribonuclease VII large subunit [Clostridia bacterium]|nr:exodeoxyribonuclease VII large subunit [Clostridia bacterium]
MSDRRIISVAQLNGYVKGLLEQERLIPGLWIRGEISNYRPHPSGHMYFTLKDGEASVSAVMFRSDAARLRFRPENGLQVLAAGRVSVFVRSGQYQLYVSELHADGAGDLFIAFEQLKEKFGREGLFDPAHKKPLPAYPRRIGVITAPSGAAVRDILHILAARWPLCEVRVLPVLVQGPGAAEDIASAIRLANERDCADLLIVGRGGGSAEDLWAFNEEPVARAIFQSRIPIISGVGHEPDVTIADLVADLRAATPSNAAELAVPDRAELSRRIAALSASGTGALTLRLRREREKLSARMRSPVMESPMGFINERRLYADHLRSRLCDLAGMRLSAGRERFARAAATLNAVSPLAVLGRGYALASREDGSPLRRAADVQPGARITLQLAEGGLGCTVDEIKEGNG